LSNVSHAGEAEGLDPASQEALKQTTQLLRNPIERNTQISKDTKAQMIDRQVQSLAGSEMNTEAIYGLSADIMAELTEKTHGDPVKMMEILEKAKNDPKGFAESLSPKNRAQLKTISTQITPQSASKPSPPK